MSIVAKNVTFAYAERPTLNNISFEVKCSQMVGIIGPNGSGKTTLLKTLCGLLHPNAGSIHIQGKNILDYSKMERARTLAVVHQENAFAFPFRVSEAVLMGRYPHLGVLALETPEDVQCVANCLEQLDLQGFENRRIHDLSGGEKQRVVIARALAQAPTYLLLDEPTAFLDIGHQIQIFTLLKQIAREKNMCILVSTHDLNLASQYCDRLLVLKQGQLCRDGCPQDIMTSGMLEDVYGAPVYVGKHPGSDSPFYLPFFNHEKSKLSL